MIKFMLMVNKQGQTRLAKYFAEFLSTDERRALEGEVVRKCLSRTDKQARLGARGDRGEGTLVLGGEGGGYWGRNELAVLEFIHCFVEVLDKHFGQVCELDIMNEPEMVHYILDEMLVNGQIVDTNKTNILEPVQLLEQVAA
ncbi:AP-4 complex subunit sigma [Tetrabaena socialis]|uniref:AP complex subunit sigma n=1 Tax=Tetrabaena socialis TaxID=47790 RepID=A0A2J8AF04_9CHLO|nr:AP-4 complex subunit sigma [Tetrabaena socialis]|eukprot:PNH11076.1 AP-4 complex subunit sigma [Tetrabaena socialis]